MSTAPNPQEIYKRAQKEGTRRLDMSTLEKVTTAFIAGVTIVFGIVALGVVAAHLKPQFGEEASKVAGALAFGIGLVFLVVGRSELFTENFFDPIAAAIDTKGGKVWGRLLWLWFATFVLNMVGGAVLVAVMTVEGALPGESAHSLVKMAEEIAGKPWTATLARAVLAGALITLLSYMLNACNTVAARILISFLAGFLLALGPFDHVIVQALHLLFGMWLSGSVGLSDLLANMGLSTLGNLAGGLLLMTLTHTAQVKG